MLSPVLSLTESGMSRLFADLQKDDDDDGQFATSTSAPLAFENLSAQEQDLITKAVATAAAATASATVGPSHTHSDFTPILSAQEQEDLITKAVAAAAAAASVSTTASASASTSTIEEITHEVQARATNPETPATDAARLSKLHTLLTAWQSGELIQKNQSFGTPYEIIEWVSTNTDICPLALYHHTRQIYYDKGKCDDKHFYMASLLKKMLDMVSLEYSIPISELCSKFGTSKFYQCAAMVDTKHMGKVIGKKRCGKVANGGIFCGTHCEHATDPVSDFKRWKSML